MPFYDFECPKCGRFEKMIRIWKWNIEKTSCQKGHVSRRVFVKIPYCRPVNPYGFHVANLEKTDFGTQKEYNEYLKRNGFSERESKF